MTGKSQTTIFPFYPLLSTDPAGDIREDRLEFNNGSKDQRIKPASDRFVDLFKQAAHGKRRENE